MFETQMNYSPVYEHENPEFHDVGRTCKMISFRHAIAYTYVGRVPSRKILKSKMRRNPIMPSKRANYGS